MSHTGGLPRHVKYGHLLRRLRTRTPFLGRWTTLVFLRDWRSTGIMLRMRLALSEFNCRLAITMTIVFFFVSGICFANLNASKRTGPAPTLKCQTHALRLQAQLVHRT